MVSGTPGIFFVGTAAVLWKEETVGIGCLRHVGAAVTALYCPLPVGCTAASILEQVMS